MKKKWIALAVVTAASVMWFAGAKAQDKDSSSLGKSIKKGAKAVGHTTAKGAKAVGNTAAKGATAVGNKTAEVASKGSSKIVDKTYKDKKGPHGETVYIDNKSQYYYVNKKGARVYIKVW